MNQEEFSMETEYIALEGKHNMKNANGSNICSKIDANSEMLLSVKVYQNFQGVEDRLEKSAKNSKCAIHK